MIYSATSLRFNTDKAFNNLIALEEAALARGAVTEAAMLRDAREALDAMAEKSAQAAQVIGTIAGAAGIDTHPAVDRALDYFIDGEAMDRDFLPFEMDALPLAAVRRFLKNGCKTAVRLFSVRA